MYPYFKADYEAGKISVEFAQELIDCIWVKLNDLNKVRDAASAEGFAGYSLFQNLIVGGQTSQGLDATNPLSFMCIEASMHVMLPQPSLSVRVWNGTPHELLIKAADLTRTGIGLPAYYNDDDYPKPCQPQAVHRGREGLQHHRLGGAAESRQDRGLARCRVFQYVPAAGAGFFGRSGFGQANRAADR